jgi:small-conductance mechanosensitive channel
MARMTAGWRGAVLAAMLALQLVPAAAQQAQQAAPAPAPGGGTTPQQVTPAAPPKPAPPPQAAPAQPVAPPASVAPQRGKLEGIKADLDQIEAGLQGREVSDQQLQALRGRIEPAAAGARAVAEELSPRAEAIRSRLKELGPKPDEKAAPESPDVTKEREEREKALAEVDETVRLARALLVQAQQLDASIADKRRSLFAQRLFEQSRSILSPRLWLEVGDSLPHDLAALSTIGSDAFNRATGRAMQAGWPMVGGVLVLFALLVLPLGRHLLAFAKKDRFAGQPSPLRKALNALAVLIAGIVVPFAAALLLYQLASYYELLPPRLLAVLSSALRAVSFVVFTHALLDAVLAPDRPAWRVTRMSDSTAIRLTGLGTLVAALATGGHVVEAVNQAIAAGLSLTAATQGGFALAIALVVARGLRSIGRIDPDDEAVFGRYVPESGDWSGAMRLVAWLLVAVVIAAAVLGFIALAIFVANQIVWLGVLTALSILVLALVDHGMVYLFSSESRLARFLQGTVGLHRHRLEQFGVLCAGVLRLMVLGLAVLLGLAPWGIESTDILGSLQAAFFGLQIGDVRFSFSAILAALVIFAVGLLLTRGTQRWLQRTYLPKTHLDVGLRTSITSAFGYFGTVGAFALAASYAGLSLDKVTIVAGALSVGIGFGLQSIVSNFVSGLILLAERGIRVGDWIVVGDEQGIVRRINVRATEIETFDRATVIMPNSNLVTGVVKNRVHSDRVGRIVIPLPVARDADPDTVAQVLREAAETHAEVLKEPRPAVTFKRIGEAALDFELTCFVGEVDIAGRVSSELTFAIHRGLAARGVPAPSPRQVLDLGGLDERLGALVDAVAKQGVPQRREPRDAAQ